MEQKDTIPPAIAEALSQFTSCVPPDRLRRTLTNLHLEYLSLLQDRQPNDLSAVSEELLCLFRFLDVLAANPVKG